MGGHYTFDGRREDIKPWVVVAAFAGLHCMFTGALFRSGDGTFREWTLPYAVALPAYELHPW